MTKPNFRQNVADEMLALIAKGTAPWQKPWDPNKVRSTPFNPTSEKTYRGMNSFWLEMQGYADPRWMTYKQAAAIGAQVQKGQKSTQIEYWQWTKQEPMFNPDGHPKLDENGKQQYQTVKLQRPHTFRANVFNAEQIDGLPAFEPPALSFDPIQKAEDILAGIDVPIIHDQADRCFYRGGSSDEIHMVAKEGFENAYDYYAVALHEIGHSTGHESRLNRDMGNMFGSEKYAIEELRAEMASYMLTTELGLGHNPDRHASYVKSWMRVIENDRHILFQAARDAELITEWVLNKEKRLEMAKGATLSKEAQEQQKKEGKSFFQKAMDAGKGLLGRNAGEPTQPAPTNEAEIPEDRVYLNVSYLERKEAKAAGARWDKDAKQWYVIGDTSRVAQWLPEQTPIAPDFDPLIPYGTELGFTYPDGDTNYILTDNTEDMALSELLNNVNAPEATLTIERMTPDEYRQNAYDKELEFKTGLEKVIDAAQKTERQYLNVPYEERHEAKKIGAKWDRNAKSWYAPEGIDGLDKWKPENTQTPRPTLDPREEFKQALQDHGFVIEGLPDMDGEWHRVPLEDDSKGKKSGSYRGFLDGVPNGQMKNFKDGQEAHQWVATGSQMTEAERIEYKRDIELRKVERAEKQLARQKEVAKVAYGIFKNAGDPPKYHYYLQQKNITPFGMKFDNGTDQLIVPLRDTEGFIWNIQKIGWEGDKTFLKESRKQGLFHVMGEVDLKAAKEFTICEGVATGASIHEATKKPVIIAFDSGNLKPVAQALRAINPDAKILIAADNDHALSRKPTQKQNVGIVSAKEAALAVNGEYTFPTFTKAQKEQKLTDYNDLAKDKGLKALSKALKPKKEKLKQMDRA